MCGRYTQTQSLENLVDHYEVDDPVGDFHPSYNIAPGQSAPVITGGEVRALKSLRWGLIPSWAKSPDTSYKSINARAETLAEKPSFRQCLARRRCLVPADGFYEWSKAGRSKTPYWFTLKDRGLFSFAGLWDRWESSEGDMLETYTIITVTANALVGQHHPRMPAILRREDEDLWLDEGCDKAQALRFLESYVAGLMKAHAVSQHVNSPDHNDALCIRPAG